MLLLIVLISSVESRILPLVNSEISVGSNEIALATAPPAADTSNEPAATCDVCEERKTRVQHQLDECLKHNQEKLDSYKAEVEQIQQDCETKKTELRAQGEEQKQRRAESCAKVKEDIEATWQKQKELMESQIQDKATTVEQQKVLQEQFEKQAAECHTERANLVQQLKDLDIKVPGPDGKLPTPNLNLQANQAPPATNTAEPGTATQEPGTDTTGEVETMVGERLSTHKIKLPRGDESSDSSLEKQVFYEDSSVSAENLERSSNKNLHFILYGLIGLNICTAGIGLKLYFNVKKSELKYHLLGDSK